MRRSTLMSGVFAFSLIWTTNAYAGSGLVVTVQDPGAAVSPTAAAQTAEEAEAAAVPETAEETAFLNQVVCRAAGRAASRLRSRVQVCDTRRAWRDMDEAAEAETRRLQNMGAYNPREDPLCRQGRGRPQ